MPTSSLFVEPDTAASRAATELRRKGDEASARLLDTIASQPTSMWLGDWTVDVTGTVDRAITAAAGKLRVFTLYDIPRRDFGWHSQGGAKSSAEYVGWIDAICAGLKGRLAWIVLEPDALAMLEETSPDGQALAPDERAERLRLLAVATYRLTRAGVKVYTDCGDSNWIPVDTMAARLVQAGVTMAAGVATNTSHYEPLENELAWAQALRERIGWKTRFVVDTSRNGKALADRACWCNCDGAIGRAPTLATGKIAAGLDGLLWVKNVGASDGECNGGPKAGAFWLEGALGLARNAAA